MGDVTAVLAGQEHDGDQGPPCAENTILWDHIEIMGYISLCNLEYNLTFCVLKYIECM